MRQTAGTIEDKIVLKRHVPDRNVLFRHERQVAVGSSDGKQTDETRVDLRRSEPMKMAVIPEQPLGHVPRHVIGVGVRHPRRDVQHDIVRISLRTDVSSMGVEIYW